MTHKFRFLCIENIMFVYHQGVYRPFWTLKWHKRMIEMTLLYKKRIAVFNNREKIRSNTLMFVLYEHSIDVHNIIY